MPFIGRGGSSPPPDTTVGPRDPTPGSAARAAGSFSRRVRPVKASRAPSVAVSPALLLALDATVERPAGAGGVSSLPPRVASALAAMSDEVRTGLGAEVALVWLTGDGPFVLWAAESR